MARGQMHLLLHQLRRLLPELAGEADGDAPLVRRFARSRDEAAFEALVRRHGPMVLGVCRRVLGDEHAAEDAFQATFLVLVKKADSLAEPELVGHWLYGVAYRIARSARDRAAQRHFHERQVPAVPRTEQALEASWPDLRAVLDEELSALPEKYRAALVLCDLEGRTHAEAARAMRCPAGSVSWRLTKARELLRARLERRGLVLSAGGLAALVAEGTAGAMVPVSLLKATVQAGLAFAAEAGGTVSAEAVALAQGALQAMSMAKLKVVLALALFVGIAGAGAGTLAFQALAQPESPPKPVEREPPPPNAERAKPVRTDAYGDPLPPGALFRLGTARLRTGTQVQSLAFLPGDKVLVSNGYQKVLFWDVATGKEIRRIEIPGLWVWTCALSLDGKVLAVSCQDKAVRLFEVTTGKEWKKFPADAIRAFAFSHNGKRLAGAGSRKLFLWDLATGKAVWQVEGQWYEPRAAAFTPDDREIVTGDGSSVLSWDAASGRMVRKFENPENSIYASSTFSPNGKLLASTRSDDKVRIMDRATEKELRAFEARGETARAISPDGRILVTVRDKQTFLRDAATGKEIHRFAGPGLPVAFSSDGKRLALGTSWAGTIQLWDVTTGKPLVSLPDAVHDGPVERLAFSPDGATLATRCFADRTIRLWETRTGKPLRLLARLETNGYAMAFAPDGRALACGNWDGTIRFWDPKTGQETRKLVIDDPTRTVDALAFSPDGRTLVTSSYSPGKPGESNARLNVVWDLASGQALARHRLDVPLVGSGMSFSPDSRSLAFQKIRDKRRETSLWNVAANRERLTLKYPDNHEPHALAFPPDGQSLAVITSQRGERYGFGPFPLNSLLRLYDLATGQEIWHVPIADEHGWNPLFSPDGKTVARATDKAVYLHDVATGRELLRRRGHDLPVERLTFSPDGKTLATGLADSTVLIWDLGPHTWRAGPPAKDLTANELADLWSDLAEDDAGKAHRAVWTLAAAPGQSLPFLAKRLQPVTEEMEQLFHRLIADLDAKQFAAREKAFKELERQVVEAEPTIRRVLADDPSAEVRRRLKNLLAAPAVIRSPESLRAVRAIRVLEQIGAAEARRALQTLAQGAKGAWLTGEAQASLHRLARRTNSRQ